MKDQAIILEDTTMMMTGYTGKNKKLLESETLKKYKKMKHKQIRFFGWDNIPTIYKRAHEIKLRNMGIPVEAKEKDSCPNNKEFDSQQKLKN